MAQAGEVQLDRRGRTAAAAEPANSGLLTLIVPAKAAQYIASVPPANIYLALVSRDYKPEAAVGRSTRTARSRPRTPSMLTPYGPDGAAGESSPA